MSFLDYLKNRFVFLFINLILYAVVVILMTLSRFSVVVIFLLFCIWFIPILSYMMIEYFKHRHYFKELMTVQEELDQKYLIAEVIEEPSFIEGQIFHQLLHEITKAMHENVNYYRDLENEYREYIEAWVHEIKTPIASTKLLLENNESDLSRKVDFEIQKVEGFIDQALYYARSQDVSKDYMVAEFPLKEVIMQAIRQNSRNFIYNKVAIELDEIEGTVFSDKKWVVFILNQILSNAVKYSKKSEGKVQIRSTLTNQNMILIIQDNGVGIDEKDVLRVFDKGFTGENGRIFGKSTGMGLYLCQKLCRKLGMGITLESSKGIGTKVILVFPRSQWTTFES